MMPQSTNVTSTSYSTSATNTTGYLRGTDIDAIEVIEEDEKTSQLGQDEFMKLLMAQMQHQDPLDPASNTEFIAQLAQFSSLEQMTQMNDTLTEMIDSNSQIADAVNNSMLVNYFGKTVTAESDAFYYDGENSVDLTFNLSDDVGKGALVITDEEGYPIRTFSLDGFSEGDNTLSWDGVSTSGSYAYKGTYRFAITAYDVLEEPVTTETLFSGQVEGLSIKDGETHLKVNNVLVPFSQIRQIGESDDDGDA